MIASKQISPRLPIVGNVKIGTTEDATSKAGKAYKRPVKLDHFRFATSDDNRKHPLAGKAAELYGSKPADIKIVFPFDEQDAILYTRRALYGSTTWACKCDNGQLDESGNHIGTATRKFKGDNIKAMAPQPHSVPCPGDICPFAEQGLCKPFAVLSFLIPELTGLQGLWCYRTTSPQTISQLQGGLAMARTIGGGSLAGLPLHLVVRPKRAEVNGKAVTIYLVSVEAGEELLEAGQSLITSSIEQRLIDAMQFKDEAEPVAKMLSEPTEEQEKDNAEEFGLADKEKSVWDEMYEQEAVSRRGGK